MGNTYLRFLSIVQTLDGTAATHTALDEVSKKLLEVVALRHQQGQAMSVSEAMTMHQIASPATIHRKLSGLLQSGWIQQVFEGKNRRTKYLAPTAAADAYFAQMDEVIEKAMQQINSTQ